MKKFSCYNINSIIGSLIGDFWLVFLFFTLADRTDPCTCLINLVYSGGWFKPLGAPVGADTANGVNCGFKMTVKCSGICRISVSRFAEPGVL